MPKHKQLELKPWSTAAPDCREKWGFAQVGKSLLKHPAFNSMTASAQMLYICMLTESGGNREFEFTRKTAMEYGFNNATFRRALHELDKSGFVSCTASGRLTRQSNIYSFMFGWKVP